MPSTRITKNDTYALLVAEGIARKFQVIPEFRVRVPEPGQTQEASERKLGRYKSIDLAWLQPLQNQSGLQSDVWPCHWNLVAAFEIDGCNVSKTSEFHRHLVDLPTIQTRGTCPLERFVVLYTDAYDRSPLSKRNWDDNIAERLALARKQTGERGSAVHVFSAGAADWSSVLPR